MKPHVRVAHFLSVLILSTVQFSAPVRAQCELQRLNGSAAGARHQANGEVSIDGDFAAVLGDPVAVPGGVETNVYIFRRDAIGVWQEHRQLLPPNLSPNTGFGDALMLRGDRLVIGAPFDNQAAAFAGAVFVYERNAGGTDNWGFVRKLLPVGALANDRVGTSVALDGDMIVAGAPRSDDAGSNSGSAYVFSRNAGGRGAWGQVARLTAADGNADHYFGDAVAVSGDVVVIGATYASGAASQSGAAYVYARDFGGVGAWGQAAKLAASDGHSGDHFGMNLSMSGLTLVVGAPDAETIYNNYGAAYVFGRDVNDPTAWTFQQKISGSDLEDSPNFGIDVEVRGDWLIAGDDSDNQNGSDAGAAYLFNRDSKGLWHQSHKFVSSTLSAGAAYFGRSVALSSDTAIIAAPYDDGVAQNSGSAWVYSLNQTDCNANGICDVRDLATGLSVDLNNNGLLDECEGYCRGLAIVPQPAAQGAGVGHAIDFDGESIAVGGPRYGSTGTPTGGAWVASRIPATGMAWGNPVQLPTPLLDAYVDFGIDVGVSGDFAVVGTPGTAVVVNTVVGTETYFEAGQAFVYRRQSSRQWLLSATLGAPLPSHFAHFGAAVDMESDLIVVGEPDLRRAHLFSRNTGGPNAWGFVRTLSPNPSAEGFGKAVALRGDRLVIGAPFENVPTNNEGAVYVFDRNQGGVDNWGLLKRVIISNGATNDLFGSSVAVDGDTVVVGATGVDGSSENEGRAFVFERDLGGINNWGQRAMLNPEAFARKNAVFGTSVALSGNRALVGAPANYAVTFNPGAVFVFDRDSGGSNVWGRSNRLVAPNPEIDDRFGSSVELQGGQAVIGSEYHSGATLYGGAVFAMSFRDGDCNLNGTCDSIDIYAELSPDINANGIPDECESLPCPADTNGDNAVNVTDLLAVITSWGPCANCPPLSCTADINDDCSVNVTDLLAIITAWGACR